ncbi:carboxypeptidase-like regulatory domain-containing protein [Arthrobacter sp. UC242_113]|uniref:carboxypeptidase-like regulatory domain-containing protein n=1 Tax=Arthrobacter sp. UC242_113 TaxID=3374550 RepID=UPI00375686B1
MRIAILLSVLSALIVTGLTPAAAVEVGGATASISGKITADFSGGSQGYTGVHVSNAATSEYVTSSYADAEGNYTASNLPAGSYKLQFFDYGGLNLGQWYGGTADQEGATVVVVAAGQQLNGIDVTLAKGATISGHVKASAGVDLSGIEVRVHAADGMSTPGYSAVAGDGSLRSTAFRRGRTKSSSADTARERWTNGTGAPILLRPPPLLRLRQARMPRESTPA